MLINVQFLRFAAAMLVVFYHTSAHVRASGVEQGIFFSISEAVGFAGVDIFFVISGFIMAYTTQSIVGIREGWRFARRRMARIYSGYWPFFLLALLLYFWINPARIDAVDLTRSAFLWPANKLLIAVAWTLIFEMFFYLLYTLLIMLSGDKRQLLTRLLLIFIICWTVFAQYQRHAYDPGNLEQLSLAEYYTLSPFMAEFLGGALLATYLRDHEGSHGWVWLLVGVILFLAGGWVNNQVFQGYIERGYHVFYRVLVFGIPSLFILTGLVRLEHKEIKAPLRFSIVAGGASYAIYLSHTLFLSLSQHLGFNAYAGGLGSTQAKMLFLAYSALILIISMLYFRILEQPLHRSFKRLLRVN